MMMMSRSLVARFCAAAFSSFFVVGADHRHGAKKPHTSFATMNARRLFLLLGGAATIVAFAALLPSLHYPRAYTELETNAPTVAAAVSASGHAAAMWLNIGLEHPVAVLSVLGALVAWLIVTQMWRAIHAINRSIAQRYRNMRRAVASRSQLVASVLPHALFFALFFAVASVAPGVTDTLGGGGGGSGGGDGSDVEGADGDVGACFIWIAVVVPTCRALWALREHSEASLELERQAAAQRAANRPDSVATRPTSVIASLASSVRRRLSKTPFAAASVGAGGGGSGDDLACVRASPAVRARLLSSAREIAHWLRYFSVAASAYILTVLPLVLRFLALGASAVRGAAETVSAAQYADPGPAAGVPEGAAALSWQWPTPEVRAPWDLRWAEGRLALVLWLQLRWTNGAKVAMGAIRPFLARYARFPRVGVRSNVVLNVAASLRLISDETRLKLAGMFEDAGMLIVLSVLFLIVPGLARCGCTVCGIIYPVFASASTLREEFGTAARIGAALPAVKTTGVSAVVSQRWLAYWVVYSSFFGLLLPTSGVFGWVIAALPFRFHLEILLICYLAIRGATRIVSGVLLCLSARRSGVTTGSCKITDVTGTGSSPETTTTDTIKSPMMTGLSSSQTADVVGSTRTHCGSSDDDSDTGSATSSSKDLMKDQTEGREINSKSLQKHDDTPPE